jgi:hypothetical protein
MALSEKNRRPPDTQGAPYAQSPRLLHRIDLLYRHTMISKGKWLFGTLRSEVSRGGPSACSLGLSRGHLSTRPCRPVRGVPAKPGGRR